jgi:N-acetylglucosaminyldiphosphoundecaprenol N-acetyl-beta-D-mannosaminyltransferase
LIKSRIKNWHFEQTGEKSSDRIHQSGAHIVFVSLGCPKQEEWMARQKGKLNAVMIGVEAAFRFHRNTVHQSPCGMMTLGLEWPYRLATEPRRLRKRYAINNPAFVLLFGLQLIRHHTSAVFERMSPGS